MVVCRRHVNWVQVVPRYIIIWIRTIYFDDWTLFHCRHQYLVQEFLILCFKDGFVNVVHGVAGCSERFFSICWCSLVTTNTLSALSFCILSSCILFFSRCLASISLRRAFSGQVNVIRRRCEILPFRLTYSWESSHWSSCWCTSLIFCIGERCWPKTPSSIEVEYPFTNLQPYDGWCGFV